MNSRFPRHVTAWLVALVCWKAMPSMATDWPGPEHPVAQQIILERMERRHAEQLEQVASLEGSRQLVAAHPLLKKPAYWHLAESYRAPGSRSLRILRGDAPEFLERQLLRPILAAEEETARAEVRPLVDISRANYSFQFVRSDDARQAYVFRLEPRTGQRYLLRGLIWIDRDDYAVKRIEGSPAQKQSIWVKHSEFVHEFGKFGRFWFPVHHRSVARLRMFGAATLEVHYSHYKWQER